jgi:hypothetical protein
VFIGFLPEWERLEPIAFVGNDGRRAAFFEEASQPRAVIGFIRQQFLRGWECGDERFRDCAIVNLPASEQESYRPAFAVRERVDFCRAAAPADAERLTPFLPCAERCALIAVESMLFS